MARRSRAAIRAAKRRDKKKDRIPKELILFLAGGTAVAAAAAVYIMTRKPTLAPAPTPKLPSNQLPPPPPGSYNATIDQLVR